MRVGKLPVYATHNLVPTPDVAGYKILYILSTDGLAYAKNSSGISGALIGGAIGSVVIGATLDASPLNTPYPAATKGTLRVISVSGSVGGGNILAPGVTVVAKDYLLCIQDSLGGDQVAAGADWVVIVPTNRVTDLAKAVVYPASVNVVADVAPVAIDFSTNPRIILLETNADGAFTLADGNMIGALDGREIVIILAIVGVSNAVVTPANLALNNTITFTNVGESATLIYSESMGTWIIKSVNGAVVA